VRMTGRRHTAHEKRKPRLGERGFLLGGSGDRGPLASQIGLRTSEKGSNEAPFTGGLPLARLWRRPDANNLADGEDGY
jgi:hypothetical protein